MSFIVRYGIRRNWEKVAASDAARIAEQTPTPGVAVARDIPYIEGGDPMHLLNVYTPEGASGMPLPTLGPLPTIVDIHGGGWVYGDKDLNRHYDMYLAAQGYAVVAMSYRLLPRTDLRGQVWDMMASLRWLAEHGADYGCDTGRVFLTGDSAGGHLASLVTCIGQSEALRASYGVESVPVVPRAVALSHSVTDMQAFLRADSWVGRRVAAEMGRMMLGRRMRRSPLYDRLSFADIADGLDLPPILVISSEADALHPQSAALAEYLARTGRAHETKLWPRKGGECLGHVFHVLHPEWPEAIETNQNTLAFFARAEGAD
ncbi:alpha/beta hydrolase [Eubacteriales bacterium OttesenSCG-928-A19]|nr:alpha/beta hydrolase [Eubacteriales bacterium OttesenSCG-928-A19]